MNTETVHGDTDNRQGWIRLGLNLLAYVAMAVWFTRGMQDNVDTQQRSLAAVAQQIGALTERVDRTNEQLARLALSQERLSEHMLDADRRVNRLEQKVDGK